MLFLTNPRIISQMSLTNEYTDNIFMDESSILDAHLRLLFRAFHYETPCIWFLRAPKKYPKTDLIQPTFSGLWSNGTRFQWVGLCHDTCQIFCQYLLRCDNCLGIILLGYGFPKEFAMGSL